MDRYLSIFLIFLIIILAAGEVLKPSFLPDGDVGISMRDKGAEENLMCHCEHHQQLDKAKAYIIDCDTADKLAAKSFIQSRIVVLFTIPHPQVSISNISISVSMLAESTYIRVETPPPKLS